MKEMRNLLHAISLITILFASISCNNTYDQISDSPVNSFREKTPEELREELRSKEESNPTTYLTVQGDYRKNLIGEMVTTGTIYNAATMARFKDINIKLTYFSKTGTAINTSIHTIYEIVTPSNSCDFKIKYPVPRVAKSVSVEIIDAAPY